MFKQFCSLYFRYFQTTILLEDMGLFWAFETKTTVSLDLKMLSAKERNPF